MVYPLAFFALLVQQSPPSLGSVTLKDVVQGPSPLALRKVVAGKVVLAVELDPAGANDWFSKSKLETWLRLQAKNGFAVVFVSPEPASVTQEFLNGRQLPGVVACDPENKFLPTYRTNQMWLFGRKGQLLRSTWEGPIDAACILAALKGEPLPAPVSQGSTPVSEWDGYTCQAGGLPVKGTTKPGPNSEGSRVVPTTFSDKETAFPACQQSLDSGTGISIVNATAAEIVAQLVGCPKARLRLGDLDATARYDATFYKLAKMPLALARQQLLDSFCQAAGLRVAPIRAKATILEITAPPITRSQPGTGWVRCDAFIAKLECVTGTLLVASAESAEVYVDTVGISLADLSTKDILAQLAADGWQWKEKTLETTFWSVSRALRPTDGGTAR
jgi:hypothetical protein